MKAFNIIQQTENPRDRYLIVSGFRNGKLRPVSEYHKMVHETTCSVDPHFYLNDALNSSCSYIMHAISPSYAIDQALLSLSEKIGASASLGETLGEGHSAFSMIAARAGTLYKAYRHIRRGRIGDFAKELLISPKEVHRKLSARTIARSSGSLWLEYWFGWSPLISDIHNATRVLVQDLPATRLRGRGRETISLDASYKRDYHMYKRMGDILVSAEVGADVFIGDGDEALRNRLGLNNPIEVAWNIIPFSWLIDWAVNIGDVLHGLKLFSGYDLRNGYCTVKRVLTNGKEGEYWEANNPWGIVTKEVINNSFMMDRTVGVPNYSFNLRCRFTGLSLTRGATAISLLLGGFRDLDSRRR